jgi:hypothetical protein
VSRSKILLGLLVVVLVAAGLTGVAVSLSRGGDQPESSSSRTTQSPSPMSSAKVKPGAPWTSGGWVGGDSSAIEQFSDWRGKPAATLTTYPAYDTWDEIIGSDWHVSNFDGFTGKLVYGLPLLPSKEPATLQEVAAGEHDDVWRAVAATLVQHGRDDSFVRIGLEANGTWFSWGATATTAKDFVAAYRHVAEVMAEVAPRLQFVFDISCGAPLRGSEDRLAPLTALYPGDDVVDVVGCDFYDAWSTKVRDNAELQHALAPDAGPGLDDLVTFARSHDKRYAVPEWGLTSSDEHGSGDNPFFIQAMYDFFYANRKDLAFENYFDEPALYLGSSLYREGQNPQSGEEYKRLWG